MYDDYRNINHFKGLDGLRALSAFMVISYHIEGEFLQFLDGKSGVSIFFVLSGYLITTLLIREEQKHGDISLKAFYIRRTFRIFPIYYVVIGIYCFLIFGIDIEAFSSKKNELMEALPYFVFYLSEIVDCGTGTCAGFGHSWTLSVEEKFYIIWPLIGFVFLAKYPRKRIIAIIALSFTILMTKSLFPEYYLSYYMILVGCILAYFLDDKKIYNYIKKIIDGFNFYSILIFFIIIHLLKIRYDQLDVIYPIAVALLIALVVVGNSRITTVLETGPLKFCGRISYGIYLVHVLAINAAQFVVPPARDQFHIYLSVFLLSIAISVLMAYCLRIFVELPMIARGRSLASRVVRTRRESFGGR